MEDERSARVRITERDNFHSLGFENITWKPNIVDMF